MAPMIIYCHPKRVEYYDYGSFLSASEGLTWSITGEPHQTYGLEHGAFGALLAQKRAVIAAQSPDNQARIELRVGAPVVRRVDMNPHGLI